MRQVRKGGKSEREAISRVDKSTTERYANCTDLSSITEVTRFEHQYMQVEITASLHLLVMDTKPSRSSQR